MGSSLKIKKSNLSEVYLLSPRLREDDKREVKAAGNTPLQALKTGYEKGTECYSVYNQEDLLIGMFGYSLVETCKEMATIWFLGSNEIENYSLAFVREGKKFINKLNQKYTLLNCVYGKNKTHIKYIECLGFKIEYQKPVICNGEVFYPFYKYKRG